MLTEWRLAIQCDRDIVTARQRGRSLAEQGPGIRDVAEALRDGYSTSHSLGLGLPGTRRLMDEFEIVSEEGKGTTVTTRKWRH